MDKARYIWRDFTNNFFSKRFLIFCIFQFTILHYYGDSVIACAASLRHPAAPWILPFMGQSVYFQCVYGISVVCFYSNIPFTQRCELYTIIRQGRTRWTLIKLLRIWLSALVLVLTEFVLSVVTLIPYLEWNLEWGKLYHTLAVSNGIFADKLRLFFPYELICENSALASALEQFLAALCVTGVCGTLMFALSIGPGRTAAILMGSFFAVLSVAIANLSASYQWIAFVSMFSWLDMLLYDRLCRRLRSYPIWIAVSVLIIVAAIFFSLKTMQTKDISWTEEE